MNLANRLTLLRLAMVPLCIVFVLLGLYIPAAAVFAIACFTDYLDGHIARKRSMITNFGKFADPVADKMLVLTVMVCLCGAGLMPAWAVCIAVAREIAVEGIRLVAVERGIVIAAGLLGKLKTSAQYFYVLFVLLGASAWAVTSLCIASSALSVVSAFQYIWGCRDVFNENSDPEKHTSERN